MDFRREYLVRLPLPLAQLYSRAFNAKDPRSRHDNTFYLCEALIKLAAAPAIACYAHDLRTGLQPHVPKLDRLLQDLALPSLGQWVGILRELSRYFAQRPSHPLSHIAKQLDRKRSETTALLNLFRRIKGGVDNPPTKDTTCSILEVFDSIVVYRNLVFGHGGPRLDSFFEKDMGPLLFPAVNELLEEGRLDFLGPPGSRLVYLTEVRMLDAEHVEVGLRELIGLAGERGAPLLLSRSQAESLLPNRVAMIWPDRPVPMPLDPLLAYRESETAVEMLFLNRDRNARQVEYLNYTTGRTERDPKMAAELSRLLSLFVGQQLTEAGLQRLAEQSIAGDSPIEASALAAAQSSRPAAKATSVSLLRRLQAPGPHESDWQYLQDIYLPLIRQWLGRVPGLGDEAADLSQEVLMVLIREIPRFERQREGSFRAWLRQVTVNRIRTHWKQRRRQPAVGIDPTDRFLDQLVDPNGDLAREWDYDHDCHVFQKLLTTIRVDFSAATLDAFQRFAVDGIPAAKVGAELGMSVNAVLHAKARVLKRLREEAGELLD